MANHLPIYMISLEIEAARREKALSSFYEAGIKDITIFPAIDGKKDNIDSYNIDRTRFQRFWINRFICFSSNNYFSDTEYACSLSHLKIYEDIVAKDIDCALILEDDAIINKDYASFIYEALDVIRKYNCDVLYLYSEDSLKSNSSVIDLNYKDLKIKKIGHSSLNWFYNRRKNVSSTASYIITKKAAMHLLSIAYPVRMQADVFLGSIAYNKLNSYKLVPNIISIANLASTITHAGELPQNKKNIISRLARKIKNLYHK